ncbi:hypothetical protein QTG56_01330 [Rossellomorea sp. AcN35-11]|nr:hypothetical protein QTG56_01330 [Rossellomorea sp. AcN35-11]
MLLTARADDADKVLGFGLGADDYVVKPFSMIELVSRVNAQIRRYTDYSVVEEEGVIRNGVLEYDPVNQTVTKEGRAAAVDPEGDEAGIDLHEECEPAVYESPAV